MSGHTPGPWSLDETDWPLIVNGPNYRESNYVALVERCRANREAAYPGDMARANARLIAAAPDMLAELRETVAALRYHLKHGTLESAVIDRLPHLDAAIAKAEGR